MTNRVRNLLKYMTVFLCALHFSHCKPQNKQVYIDAPVIPQGPAKNGQESDQTAKQEQDPPEDKKTLDNAATETIFISAQLDPQCILDQAEKPTENTKNKQDHQKNPSGSVVSELDEAQKTGMGRRAGLEPGQMAPVISIEHGAMYLHRDQEGTYSIKPAFENDSYFTEHVFTVGEDQLTEDEQNFKYSSENDLDTEFYISVESPEFGIQNCSVNEVCEDSEENQQSNLYLLRYNTMMFDKLKNKSIPEKIYSNKTYTVYALSPKFNQFCKNQTAKIDTQIKPTAVDPETKSDATEKSVYELAIKQATDLNLSGKQQSDLLESEEQNKSEDHSIGHFKVYYTHGKNDQAIIYFISDQVWYMALERLSTDKPSSSN